MAHSFSMWRLTVIALIAAAASGCGSNDNCASTAVEVHYVGGDRDGEIKCRKMPTACGGHASCADTTCLADIIALCDAPYAGITCNDTVTPTIITCNPAAAAQ